MRSIEPAGKSASRMPTATSQQRSIDAAGRVTATLNAKGFRTTQVYDAASRLVAVVDANGHRNSFVYDADSRQTQPSIPSGAAPRMDSMRPAARPYGSMPGASARAMSTTTLTVSLASTILTARGSHSPTTTPAAVRCSMTATGRTTSTYDADGRLSAVINPAGLRLTYAYDAASQRKYLTEPEGARFTYVFDPDGRTSYVTNPAGASGQPGAMTRPAASPAFTSPTRRAPRTCTTTPAGSCAWPI